MFRARHFWCFADPFIRLHLADVFEVEKFGQKFNHLNFFSSKFHLSKQLINWGHLHQVPSLNFTQKSSKLIWKDRSDKILILKPVENKSAKNTLFLYPTKNSFIHKKIKISEQQFPQQNLFMEIWKFNKKTFDWKYQLNSVKIWKSFFWTFLMIRLKIGNPFLWNSSTFQIQILRWEKFFVDSVLTETFQSFSLVFDSPTPGLIFDFIEFDTWDLLTPFSFFWYFSLLNIEHAKKIKFQLSERFYFSWEFSIIRPKFCQIFNRKENPIIIPKGIQKSTWWKTTKNKSQEKWIFFFLYLLL
jgi:hypothetical protein